MHLLALLGPAFWQLGSRHRKQGSHYCSARSWHTWCPDILLSQKQRLTIALCFSLRHRWSCVQMTFADAEGTEAMLDNCPVFQPEAKVVVCAGDLCRCRGHPTTGCAAACPRAVQALPAAGRALLCGTCSCSQAVWDSGRDQTFSKACICLLIQFCWLKPFQCIICLGLCCWTLILQQGHQRLRYRIDLQQSLLHSQASTPSQGM